MSARIRPLSSSHRPVFLLNSRLNLFSAAHVSGLPLSRSYGVILPSSLTSVLPFVLGFSPRLPVSVCGTGALYSLAVFLASVKSRTSLLTFGRHHTPALGCVLHYNPASVLTPALPSTGFRYPSVSLLRSNIFRRYWNLYQLSITYDFTSSA